MKVEELFRVADIQLDLEGDQMNEGKLKNAVAATIVGTALMTPNISKTLDHSVVPRRQTAHVDLQKIHAKQKLEKLVGELSKEYKKKPEFIATIVDLAHKYEKNDFPKASDIIAIAAIESSFNPNAVSNLEEDPAIGLMQIRPGVWGLDAESLKNPETAIKTGSDILHHYYKKLGNRDSAVQAYNVGISNYRKGKKSIRYLTKFADRLKQFFS